MIHAIYYRQYKSWKYDFKVVLLIKNSNGNDTSKATGK